MPIPINISASRGAGILGVSSYKSQIEIWLEIMESRNPGFCAEKNYNLPKPTDNAAIRWGNAFEDVLVFLAEKKRRKKIVFRERLYEFEYLSCHIDGKYSRSKILHEGKTTSQYYFRENFGEPGTDRIPREYQVQVQHQMMLTNAKKCILSVLVFPKCPDEFIVDPSDINSVEWATVLDEMGYFHQYEISENKNLQAVMIEKYKDFWETFIICEKIPPASLYSDFSLLVKNPNGTILANEQVERWASEYKQINSENSDLVKRKEQLKVLILEFMKKQDSNVEKILDDDSCEKWVLRDRAGKKLFQYNGKVFR